MHRHVAPHLFDFPRRRIAPCRRWAGAPPAAAGRAAAGTAAPSENAPLAIASRHAGAVALLAHAQPSLPKRALTAWAAACQRTPVCATSCSRSWDTCESPQPADLSAAAASASRWYAAVRVAVVRNLS